MKANASERRAASAAQVSARPTARRKTKTASRKAAMLDRPGEMRAAVVHEGEQSFRLETVPTPTADAGEVVVRVMATGLTRGVLSLWRARGLMRVLPTILGYETSGVVASVGADVTAFHVGDRVRLHPVLSCGQCNACLRGDEQLCDAVAVIGGAIYSDRALPRYTRYHNGGLAEYLVAPSANLDPLPENVSFEVGARVHSAAIAYHALSLAELSPGATLVVTAATGGVGAAALAVSPLFGVSKVIAVSRRRESLREIQTLLPTGSVEILPTEELPDGWQTSEGLTQQLRALSGGREVDAVLDLMPASPEVSLQAIYSMRKGGVAVLAGGNHNELPIMYTRVMRSGYAIRGSNGYARRDAQAILEALATGKLDPAPIITHRFPLAEVNTAADTIWQRRDNARFVMVYPPEEE
ncbi:MAG TPA: alcohol dehydrogenase catalytic domain-containing protein [Ktedonobacterales bacterium]|nr:alcohol dehydrogenase catalytic domain-containing protein [Ktedonobacterales bacterium]